MINKSVHSLIRGMNDAMSPHLVRDGESAYIKGIRTAAAATAGASAKKAGVS